MFSAHFPFYSCQDGISHPILATVKGKVGREHCSDAHYTRVPGYPQYPHVGKVKTKQTKNGGDDKARLGKLTSDNDDGQYVDDDVGDDIIII